MPVSIINLESSWHLRLSNTCVQQQPPFYDHYTGQPVLASTPS